jgi:CO dehydrogenase maturation factor
VKIAISGKGGVGKTTVAAMLAVVAQKKYQRIIAVDADPDANLGSALGLRIEDEPVPLSEMRDLIAERTGAESAYGGYFKLNPRVDDIPDRYAARIGNIRVLALGGVEHGGGGCICPATALTKALLAHLLVGRDDAVIMDMEAGIEHLGRGTAQSMDSLIIVVDDGPWSMQTARRVRRLAEDIEIAKVYAVANRLRSPVIADRIRGELGTIALIGEIPFDDRISSGAIQFNDDGSPSYARWLTDYEATLEKILSLVVVDSRAGLENIA